MAAGPKAQYAHLANLAADFVRKRPNLYELAKMLPDNGVGSKFARTRWEARGAPDSFWTVTKVRPKASGRAGKAWGTLTWKGEEKGKEVRIPKAMTAGIWKVVGEEPPRRGPAIPELAAAPSASSGSDPEAARE